MRTYIGLNYLFSHLGQSYAVFTTTRLTQKTQPKKPNPKNPQKKTTVKKPAESGFFGIFF